MNAENVQNLKMIADQIPNPWIPGNWYDVSLPNGKQAQAMRTKPGYLRIRKLMHHVKSPSGEIINDHGMQYSYFRACLKTGSIQEM